MAWELNLKAKMYNNPLVTNKIISSVIVGVDDGAKADATLEEKAKNNSSAKYRQDIPQNAEKWGWFSCAWSKVKNTC